MLLITALLAGGITGLIGKGLVAPMEAGHKLTENAMLRWETAALESARQAVLVAQTDEAFRGEQSETAVLNVLARATTSLAPDRPGSILLAQPNSTGVCFEIPFYDGGLGDPIELDHTPRCGALSTRSTSVTNASSELDACGHLGRHEVDVAGVCILITSNTTTVGVLCITSAPGERPDEATIKSLELLARLCADNIARIRKDVPHGGEDQVDSLTGLPLHTAVSRRMVTYSQSGDKYALALCDLDNFESFVEEHGRGIGDLVLQQFALTLRKVQRPGDVSGRYSGDRFLCVLGDCDALQAQAVMERIREAFLLDLVGSELPTITASFGVAASTPEVAPADLVEIADVALVMAKNGGGNRVQTSDFSEAN